MLSGQGTSLNVTFFFSILLVSLISLFSLVSINLFPLLSFSLVSLFSYIPTTSLALIH
jgi:hypothetical protein